MLEVEFSSVYAARGLLLRHADVGRASTFGNGVAVSVKGSDGSWSDVATTKTDHDTRRMLLDFGTQEVEMHGLRLRFTALDANKEHGIYEVLAKDGRVVQSASVRSRRGVLEGGLDDGVGCG